MPTPDQLTALQAVDDAINSYPYRDPPDWSNYWGDIRDTEKLKGYGVCVNYALGKRNLLVERGWDIDTLFLVCCYTEPVDGYPQGQHHCVLGVDTGDATMILDNRFPPVYEWDKGPAPYSWEERQQRDPATGQWQWVRIGNQEAAT